MSAYFFCVVCVGNRSDIDRKYKIIKYNRNISGIYTDYDGLAVIT